MNTIYKKTAIIDVDGLMFVAGHPNKVLDENGEPTRTEDGKRFNYVDKTEEELILSVDTLMESILTVGEFDSYIGFVKGKNTTGLRLAFNPEYKANRKTDPPLWWKTVKNRFVEKWGVIAVNDMEVDDAVNITRLQVPESYIVASDKDELLLHGTHYNWVKNEWLTVEKADAEYAFWKSMIVGDSVDNIKGVPGVGKANEIFSKGLFVPKASYVLELYIHKFGESLGISEFNKNYQCLKIVDKNDTFVIPEIIKYEKQNVEEANPEEWTV